MQTVRNALLVLVCLVVLGACGNKGPLYLPDENPVPNPAAAREADTEADDSENKEDTGKNNPDYK
jgi:predicted small lipoprotein YifL